MPAATATFHAPSPRLAIASPASLTPRSRGVAKQIAAKAAFDSQPRTRASRKAACTVCASRTSVTPDPSGTSSDAVMTPGKSRCRAASAPIPAATTSQSAETTRALVAALSGPFGTRGRCRVGGSSYGRSFLVMFGRRPSGAYPRRDGLWDRDPVWRTEPGERSGDPAAHCTGPCHAHERARGDWPAGGHEVDAVPPRA